MDIRDYSKILSHSIEYNQKIKYIDLLSTTEWRAKRDVIMERDIHRCTLCLANGSIIKDKKAYRYKTKEEIQKCQNEIDEAYEQLMPIRLEMMKSLFPPDFKIPKMRKIDFDSLERDFDPTILHVHHNYYIKGHLPWEYKEEALIKLCQNCHERTHQENDIPIYSFKEMIEKLNFKKCLRCSGSGYVDKYYYFLDGICFQCNGEKYDELI